MKIGLSLPIASNFRANPSKQHAGMVKMQSLQKDTVSFKANEKAFDKYFREFMDDEWSEREGELAAFRNDVDKSHPIIKKLLEDYNKAKAEGKIAKSVESYIDEFVLPVIT